MKKLFLSILAIATLASCTKDESFYTEQDSEIKLAPVAAMSTKANVTAAIDGTAYPKAENFDVYAYWKTEDAGATFKDGTPYLTGSGSGVEFVNKDQGKFWSGAVTYYWPKNGSLRFAAYSPSSVNMTHEQGTDTYTLSNLVYPTNTDDTYEIMVAPTSPSYTAQTATENVSVVFEHALSWITFKVKSSEEAANVFTVKNIVVNDVYNTGTLTANMTDDTKVWALSGEADKDINVYYDKTSSVGVNPKTLENKTNGLLVLPQATTSVTVVFDQAGVNGTPTIENQTVTIPLVLNVENTPWEPGKHYTYTIIFDLDEILINPSIEDWEDVNVNDVPATDVEVATAQEFAEAVNNASQIRLVDDIVLTQNFHIDESLNIDLNGHTITFQTTPEIPFRVNNGATLTIGRGDIVSDDYIVSVNAGGKLVMNEGNYTASTTVVNVNGGEAYITGGYFVDNSTYNGQYLLNHVDAQKDNGLIKIT